MKTSAARPRRQGFTLLEMVMVMSVMVLIMAIGFTSFSVFDQEDPLDKPAQQLVQMSKFALQSAVLQHRGMTIAFDEEGFGVPGAGAGPGARQTLPAGMKLFIHRLGGKGWEKAEGHRWPFGEQGICEPVRVRFETATTAREIAFHPLTGGQVE